MDDEDRESIFCHKHSSDSSMSSAILTYVHDNTTTFSSSSRYSDASMERGATVFTPVASTSVDVIVLNTVAESIEEREEKGKGSLKIDARCVSYQSMLFSTEGHVFLLDSASHSSKTVFSQQYPYTDSCPAYQGNDRQ